jgi:hypothetical protein
MFFSIECSGPFLVTATTSLGGERHRANKKMTAPDANLPSADPERHRARPYLIHPDAAAPSGPAKGIGQTRK